MSLFFACGVRRWSNFIFSYVCVLFCPRVHVVYSSLPRDMCWRAKSWCLKTRRIEKCSVCASDYLLSVLSCRCPEDKVYFHCNCYYNLKYRASGLWMLHKYYQVIRVMLGNCLWCCYHLLELNYIYTFSNYLPCQIVPIWTQTLQF